MVSELLFFLFSELIYRGGENLQSEVCHHLAFILKISVYCKGNVLVLWSGEERQSWFDLRVISRFKTHSKIALPKNKHVFSNLSMDNLGSNLKQMSSVNDQHNSNMPSKI